MYSFETDDPDLATAALLVYAVWRSRDRRRYKVTPDVWGQVERFTKAAAKRAANLPRFLEALKPRVMCDTIHPAAIAVGVSGTIPLIDAGDGALIELAPPEGMREFGAGVIESADDRAVLDRLYRETAYVIVLVRTRLEAEKPIERRFETALDTIGGTA